LFPIGIGDFLFDLIALRGRVSLADWDGVEWFKKWKR